MPHSTHGSSSTNMSRSSDASTNSAANAFPKPAGAALLAPETATDRLSPSRSTFSFESSPASAQLGPEDEVPGMQSTYSRPSVERRSARQSTRQRHRYFEEQFAYKDDATSAARDRVVGDAPIIADLRTNVIIKDEYTLVTDLSHHLSQRYQRPESSIMITVNHSACLLLGGSFDPTYVLSISALPVQLQPTTNKRNAALIQKFMFESIGVQAERGIVKFIPIAEENLAINGTTILGDVERLERQTAGDNQGLMRALTKSSKRSGIAKAKSNVQLSRTSSRAVGGDNVTTSPLPSPGPLDSGVAMNDEGTDSLAPLQSDGNSAKKKPLKHSGSKFMRDKSGASTATTLVPGDAAGPRLGSRKSFIALFRR
ncbi:Tautomerase/MIF [Westerdykella ornata]|uniref:L-dopachrome isomerase n=1 Tax=Westerdykella ornata TaxID=318751 RepID=A0A6A6JM25_WESOR|nr:Tautomerase/MIF [Westerdykella ornata]KAF2277285.1 Tautomerase/MIF [Westerdykella ornata]